VASLGLIALVLVLTSGAAVAIGAKWWDLDPAALWPAGLKTLEVVGMSAIFFAANLVTGMILIAAARATTGWFVSHYILSDVTLLGLSLVQGVVFVWWQRGPRRDAS
jgi:hypothetical protein